MRMVRESEETFDVPMAPLLDMMFTILVFFLVVSQFADPEKDQNVRVPQASAGTSSLKQPDEIIVNVRQGGVLVVGGRILTADELDARLVEAARKDPKQIVRIRGDALAYHKQVVRVLEACTKAKILNVSIVTRTKE